MKWILVVLCWVVGLLVERVGDLGGFTQFGGTTFAWWVAFGCYFLGGWLLMGAAREYWKKKRDPNE